MPDEFTPGASVDFEALAAAAAEVAQNGDGPHYTPPPETPQEPPGAAARPRPNHSAPSGPSLGMDPFQALERIMGEQSLMFRELGDINARLSIIQLQAILAFGGALLLAVIVWKLARPSP